MKGLNEIKNALIAFAKKAKFKDGGKAISTKVKSVSAGQLAKIAGAAELANLFDSAVEQAPILSNIYKWWAQTVDTIYSNTVYKIPGVGDFIKFMSDKLGEFVVPNAQRHIKERRDNMNKKVTNSPKFYENLDLHKTFSIPGGYTKKTAVNGTLGTPKIVAHRLIENPMPDKSAVVDRLNQKYSLIKAVRGLSATVYTITDLFNYERFAKLNLLQYYVIKKVIKAAKTYSLAQVSIGDNIIASLGFSPAEVRENLASYETLLCQMHRFISNNLPVSGTWEQRLEYLVEANIPDYADPKVATIHMFSVSMTKVFKDSADTTGFVFDCIPGAANNSYDVILNNFKNYQQAIVDNTNWQQLIADYFGAFGAKAMWQDSDYPAYANPLDLRNADNDLSREQVKNAFYANSKVSIITINENVPNKKIILDVDDLTPVQLPGYKFGDTFGATQYSALRAINYTNILSEDCYMQTYSGGSGISGLGNLNFILLPDMNGIGAQGIKYERADETPFNDFISMNNHETIYTLHKDNYSEGEALEISQFKCRSIGARININGTADTVSFDVFFKTHEYVMADSTVYVFGVSDAGGSTYTDRTFKLCNEAFTDDDLQDQESGWDYPSEIMCWALIDWMPLLHFTAFAFGKDHVLYYAQDIALLDMDSFGSLDDRAFSTSINYSIYSLQAAGLTIGNKRVDNLGNIYKDKPSKRG